MKIYGIATLMMLFACTSSTTYVNRDIDKNAAKIVVGQFYEAAKKSENDKLIALFNISTKHSEGEEQTKRLITLLDTATARLGNVESYKIVSNETRIVETSRGISGNYTIVVKLKRTSQQRILQEKFELVRIDNHILINNFQSDSI